MHNYQKNTHLFEKLMFKTFIPPQTDRMTHSFIGCSESKVILFSSDEKTQQQQQQK